MTNFEFYTQDPQRLSCLLYMAIDDALEAKGCWNDLKLPEAASRNAKKNDVVEWTDWLMEERQVPGGEQA